MTGQTTIKLEYYLIPRGLLICRARSHEPAIIVASSGGYGLLHDVKMAKIWNTTTVQMVYSV